MKRNRIRKATALLLMAALCVSLCTGFAANAGEPEGQETEGMPGLSEGEESQAQENPSDVPESQDEQEPKEQDLKEQELSEPKERRMSARAPASDLHAPRIAPDSSMTAGQKVTWDCVWFGSYPQAEVVSSSGAYTALDENLLKNGDVIVDRDLHRVLEKASGWDDSNEITIDGNRYRRMKMGDATYATYISSSSNNYQWSDSTTYHYFKYEPIKWRVLKTNGGQALLLSDVVLDDQKYHTVDESVTWETSTIRSWLNGYGMSANQQGIDYSGKNFIGSAFTSSERSAIRNTFVVNADNIEYGTEGGNDTTDQVFLLSEAEVYGDNAVSHGFVSNRDTYDEARRCKSSTYAKAMGIYSSTNNGDGRWHLRSPGRFTDHSAEVYNNGRLLDQCVGINDDGVRAALNLNLSFNQWSYAGTVSSGGKMNEEGGGTGGDTIEKEPPFETDYESDVVSFMMNKGTLNTIKYLCKDSNFTNSIYVHENDGTFGSAITMILSDVYYRGLDGWKDLFSAATSKEDAEKILAALLQEYQADVEELAMAKNAKKYAGYFVKGLKDYMMTDAIVSSLNDRDIKNLSSIITEEKVADLLVNGKYETLSAYFQVKGGYSENSEIVKTLDNYMNSKKLADRLSKGLDFLDTGLTILSLTQDTFNYLYQLESLVDADEIYSEMLVYLKENCCYDVVKDAAADLYNVIHGSYIKQLSYVSSALKNALVDKALDSVIDEAVSAIPCGKIIKTGFDWGVNLSNSIFHIADTQQLRDSMRTVAYIGNCLSLWTLDNQRGFLTASTSIKKNEYARKLYYSLYMLWNTRKVGEETLQSMFTKSYMKWSKYYTVSLQTSSTLDSLKDSIFTDHMTQSFISVTVACPVDIEVYSAAGKLVTTVKDGREDQGCVDRFYYYVRYQKLDEDYVKILCFPEDSGYTLKYIGKSIGTVDSEIVNFTEEGGTERKYFENVAVQKNTVIAVTPDVSISQTYTVTDPSSGTISEETFESEPETYISVEQIKLKENKIKITSGSKKQLIVDIIPDNATDKKMLWSSSDEAIAVVNSDGVITAKSEGKCTIQCTSISKDGCYSGAEVEVLTDQSKVKVSKIALSGVSNRIAAGKKLKLTANVFPANASNKKVTWKSSNPKAASVDSEGVVMVKKGSGGKKVTITATAKDGSGVKGSYNITSMKGVVKKITLSGISKKIAAGKKINLTAKVTASKNANRTLSWKSSDTKAATVTSKGAVTLKKNSGGKRVTITASATDGSGKKASYKITSMKGTVKKVAISGRKTRSVTAGKSLQLKAKVTASNAKKANRKLKWTSSNKKYAAVSSAGKVKTKKAGKGKKVKITAMATDGSGKKSIITIRMQ